MSPDEQTDKLNGTQQQTYVPVHRRSGSFAENGRVSNEQNDDDNSVSALKRALRNSKQQQQQRGAEVNDPARHSGDLSTDRRSSRNFAWSRNNNSNRQSFSGARFTGDEAAEDSDVTTDVSVPSTPASNNNRFSRSEYYQQDISRRSSTADKLHSALEALSMNDTEAQREDYEELLRQYDRYDDDDKAANRRSKRASRLMDPFNEPPAEIPVVEEPTVILDCYDFPPAFKTHHLHDIFREYENMRGGYRIKWMDDTRALIIFEHPATAKKAYIDNVSNPLAKIRPYNGPTDFLRSPTGSQQASRRPNSVDMKRFSYGGAGARSSVASAEQRQSIRGTN